MLYARLEWIGDRWRGLFPQAAEANTPGCEICDCHFADHFEVVTSTGGTSIFICPSEIAEIHEKI